MITAYWKKERSDTKISSLTPGYAGEWAGVRGARNSGCRARDVKTFLLGQVGGEGQRDFAVHPSNDFSRASCSAFTLVELLVTLVIISVLAAATLPTVKNVLVERKSIVAALEVKGFLESARARAIAHGRPVSVILERLSSRWEGAVVGAINQSSTAKNVPGSVDDNFDVYNTCIRMVMAESLRPAIFELSGFAESNDLPVALPAVTDSTTGATIMVADAALSLPSSYTSLFVDGDDLPPFTFSNATPSPRSRPERGRILRIPNTDPRLYNLLLAGNEIELFQNDESTGRFKITAPLSAAEHQGVPTGSFLAIAIRNEGASQFPWGSVGDVDRFAQAQIAVSSFVPISSFGSFAVSARPRPVASMVTELPKGTCIDLSLSGLAVDDTNVNLLLSSVALREYRDCRREFASDWILPPIGSPTPIPVPQDLRPVYLTFGPNGLLQSVLCNGPSSPNLRRIEPQSDVCLFVGRNDQVIRTTDTGMLAAALDTNLKPNLLDATAFWIRISPSSGVISSSPAQAAHIIEDVQTYRSTSVTEPIGHLLEDSRSLTLGSEQTSQ